MSGGYPKYNINVGVGTEIESLIKIKTYKYHPYGLEDFRKNIIQKVDEWQSKGFRYNEHDNLTHAWRSPWDTHLRYDELMSPIAGTATALVKNHSPSASWFLADCWISDYVSNSGANKHNHGSDSLGWSFCYYVKVPDVGPGFTLIDDVEETMHQINVAEGDLLLFRHPLMHQVFPATERRIIISGNIMKINFAEILTHEKYCNENIQNEWDTLTATHKPVDVDNWDSHVYEQKLGIKYGSGGY